VSGEVTDPSGAVVAGATVSARQTETNLTSMTMSDGEGRFRFAFLKVGPYEIKVQQQGFADAIRPVTLTVGAAFDLPISLAVASSKESVTVNDQPAVIEAVRTQLAGTVIQEEVNQQPLNGRSFLDLTLLVPGVSPTNTASTQLFPETSAVPGQGISVSSQRNFSNNFIVDGVSANDDAAGLVGTFYGLDVVQEFQVVTSGGHAEFGRALGGYINMVTKSGTNLTRGDLYGYLRNKNLSATNALTGTRLPMTQAQYGASLGGPIVQDRTFYFGNFEQRMLNQAGNPPITIPQTAVDQINTRLKAVGHAGPLITTGLYSNPVHMTTFLGKLDHQLRAKDQFSIRYSLYDVRSDNSRGVGGVNAASASAGLSNLDQTVTASDIHTFSPLTVNETRVQFINSNLKAPPTDPIGPAVSITGTATFGTLSGSPTARLDRSYQAVDSLSHQAGAHAIRTGVDFLYNDTTITFPRSVRGSYSFGSLANFLSGTNGTYTTFTQTFGNPLISQHNPNVGFYGQDQWRVRPGLTLNAGLRYDLQFLKTISTDTNNLSPRVGLAWSPFASGNTVVRASFGLFYDRVPLRALANTLLSAGNTTDIASAQQLSVSLQPTQTGAPLFPTILPSVSSGVLLNFTTMDPHLQNAYSEQASLEIERQIGSRSTFAVNYQHVRGTHLIVSVNLNTPACTATSTNNGCRPVAAYGDNKQYSPAADSQYDGLTLSFVQRPTKWGNFRISYTYSKAMDDVGEFFFSAPLNNYNIHQDWSRADDDQRHRFVFDGSIHSSTDPARTAWQRLSHGFQLSTTLQYYSALPFNIVTGVTNVQTTTSRPCLGIAATNANCTIANMIGRNAGIGFDFFNVNTRLSRTFPLGERLRLQAIAEAFNALNHRNNQVPNTRFGSGVYPTNPVTTPVPGFGDPTAVADPRQVQLALRLSF
jgi:hypothetical protein